MTVRTQQLVQRNHQRVGWRQSRRAVGAGGGGRVGEGHGARQRQRQAECQRRRQQRDGQSGKSLGQVDEERAEHAAQKAEPSEDGQLAQVPVGLRFEEGPKGDEARVREGAEVALPLDRRQEKVERERRAERAEEGAPGERLGPVGGGLLHREERAADGRAECRRHPCRRARRDKVALVVVVPEALEPHRPHVACLGGALGDAGRDDRADVDHGTLLAHDQPARDRAEHAHRLCHQSAGAEHAGHLDALQDERAGPRHETHVKAGHGHQPAHPRLGAAARRVQRAAAHAARQPELEGEDVFAGNVDQEGEQARRDAHTHAYQPPEQVQAPSVRQRLALKLLLEERRLVDVVVERLEVLADDARAPAHVVHMAYRTEAAKRTLVPRHLRSRAGRRPRCPTAGAPLFSGARGEQRGNSK
eukprot:scaffold7704_cov112-Isochrysis_galbana.AAC.20